MHVDRRLLFFGVFFIVFGGVLLGARQGWIPEDVVASLWQLWPVLLIAIGLSIILARGPGAWIGGAFAAAVLGVMAAGLVQTGIVPFVGCGGGDQPSTPFEGQSGQLASTSSVGVTFSCGELQVTTASGSEWTLEGSSKDGRGPDVRTTDGGIEIEARERTVIGFGGGRETWRITLPREPTIDLGLTLNAGTGRLELAGAHLAGVDVTVNAGSLSLDFRDAEAMQTLDGTVNAGSNVTWLPNLPIRGDLTVNAGSLVICAPEGPGAAARDRRQPDLVERLRPGRAREDRRRLGDARLRDRGDPDGARRDGERGQPLAEPDAALRRMTVETRLFLIRHGETAWSASGQHTSRTDLPLTANGIRQAELLAARLARLQFAAVFSSPMLRALDTCRIAGLESAAIVTDDLREWDYGVYEGRTTDEIRAEEPGWTIWTAEIRGGETVEDVGRRVDRVIEEALGVEGDVALFGHGHCLRILAARWVGLPPVGGALLELSTATVSRLGWERENARHRALERGEPPGPWLSDGRPGGAGDVPGTLGAVTARTPDDPSATRPARARQPARRAVRAPRRGGGRGPRDGPPDRALGVRGGVAPRRDRPERARGRRAGLAATAHRRRRHGAVRPAAPRRGRRRGRARRGPGRAARAHRAAADRRRRRRRRVPGRPGARGAARRRRARRAGAPRRVGRGRARARSSSRAMSCSSGPATSSRRTCD